MKLFRLALLFILVANSFPSSTAYAQYIETYNNNFRNWQPDQGWVIINNDTTSQTPGLVTESFGVTYRYALGICDGNNHSNGGPGNVPGIIDKILISPPFILGSNPWVQFYSRYRANREMSFWVIPNSTDTTLGGLSDSITNVHNEGFNAFHMSNYANDTIRLAWRIRGNNTYGYLDDLLIVDKQSLVYIPDSCFRSFLLSEIPNAFINDSLDYFHTDAMNLTSILNPNGCVQSLEGLQYLKHAKDVDFNDNQVSYIPQNTMYYVDSLKVMNNFLTRLPPTPRCKNINAANNLLTEMPEFAYHDMRFLRLRNNLIYDCLPGTNRFVRGSICNNISIYKGGYVYYNLNCAYSYPSAPSICSQQTGYVNGVVYYDINNNNIKDTADILIANQMVDFMQGRNIVTSSTGRYGAGLLPGYVNFNVTKLPSYFNCTNPLNDSLSAKQTIQHDFRIVSTSSANDLQMFLNTTGTVRSFENIFVNLTVRNRGTDVKSGTVCMAIPQGFTLADPGAATIVNDSAFWTVSINPFQQKRTMLEFIADSVSASVLRTFIAEVKTTGDILPSNNISQENVMHMPAAVVWSPWNNGGFPFDPNNKLVSTPRVSQGFQDYLYYNINFENIGTANASRVMVRDVLSSDFDVSSFEFIAASHPCTVTLTNDSLLQFLFQPIALTPTSVDSINSHGHIWFRIKPAAAMQIGDTLRNSAAIYFDNVAPVVTEVCKVWVQNSAEFTSDRTEICPGNTVKFVDQSTATPTAYQWTFQGGTPSTSTLSSPEITYNTSGTYDVQLITNWNGAVDSTYKIDFVTVYNNAVAIISSSGPTSFCEGDSVQLIGNLSSAYSWSNGDTTQQITVDTTGSFTLLVVDSNACTNTSPPINVIEYPNPATPTISLIFDSLFTSIANSYQWYLNGALINGANQAFHIATTNGNYAVEITDTNSCSSLSQPFNFTSTEVSSNSGSNELLIYPNPSNGFVNIKSKSKTIQFVEICDALGKIVEYEESLGSNYQFDMSSMPKGVYTVRVLSDSKYHIAKVVLR